MPDSLYGARLQGITVVVFIVAKSRIYFDEYNYHNSLQARIIEGIEHWESRWLVRWTPDRVVRVRALDGALRSVPGQDTSLLWCL